MILQNRKIFQTEYEYRYGKEKSLKEYFKDYKTRDEQNIAIINAIEDDYKQVEVARYLNISDSAVSTAILIMKNQKCYKALNIGFLNIFKNYYKK